MEYSPGSRPLEHAVLIHADPAGQRAAVGTLSPSDCFPAGPAGPYVAGGSVGPNVSFKVLELLQHSVLDHADPAGQHAAVGTLSPSDCYPAGPAGPCVAGGPVGPDNCLQVLEPFEVLDMEMRNDNLDSSEELQFGSDRRQSSLELEDAIRREVQKSRSMGRAQPVMGTACCYHRRMLGWVIRVCLWMRSVWRAYGSGIWTWMWNINMRHLTVCRCIMVEICMIKRIRRSTIL